jgi:hypothetical protein
MPPRTRVTTRRLWLVLQALVIGAGVWYAAQAVAGQWGAVRAQLSVTSPRWGLIVIATGLVLATHLLLVAVWRVVLAGWGGRLAFPAAMHVWFVSNLGKYVPGKVWQIAALSAMVQRRGVSPVAATGAALLVNLANVASGGILVLAAGAPGMSQPASEATRLLLAALALVALFGGAALLPFASRMLTRLTGRDLRWPRLSQRVLLAATAGTAAAWMLYGVAFRLLATGLHQAAAGALPAWIAVYTGSYLAGYLTPAAPGGVVIREVVLVRGMVALGLASEPGAWLVALASRLWLTIVELAPAGVALSMAALRRAADARRTAGEGGGAG